ncbi:MAG: hypothetical protein ACPGUH_01820 [Winogradskyella sp.]
MKYLDTKHERKSATITVLLLSILVLLCFVVGQPYMDPPAEYGVALDFGNSSSVNNNIQAEPSEPASKSEEIEEIEPEEVIEEEVTDEVIEEEVVEEEVVEDTTEEEAIEAAEKEAAEAAEKLLTQKAEEALKIKEAKEAKDKLEREAKEKAEKEAKEKADRVAKAKAAKEAKQKAAKAKADAAAKKAAKAAAAAAKKAKEGAGNKTVPFSSLEDYPIYPGCEGGDKNTQRKCMNAKLKQFLAKNFNKELPSELGLTGVQDIKIYFVINNQGRVVSIRAKAAKPELVAEAKRVSKLLPKMKPAMQNGKAQAVDYYLPLKIQTGN